MWFGVLGHLEVYVDGEVVKIPSARQRTVLATLLTRANQVVTADELVEYIWDGTPPTGARTTLRSYVMRLRRSIGSVASTRVSTREPGYLIEIADDELDLLVFGHRFQRGRQAERARAWEECVREMSCALDLWRGEPLSDVPAQSLLSNEVPRLMENKLQALESRINAELHLGRHEDVIGELVELVVAHPLREHFVAQLMLALYRAGRQAEALDTYGVARQRLVDELGIEPSGEVRRLQQLILANDPSLTSPEPRVRQRAATVPVKVAKRPDRPALPVPRQLPHALQDFTGRQGELKRIMAFFEQSSRTAAVPIVHIHGAPSVGKTALAVLAAHQVAELFPDGQLYIPLRKESGARREVDEVVHEVLRTLGTEPSMIPHTFPERVALYRSLLAGKRMLLVVDDARNSAHILPLLPGVAGSGVIVTSRRQNIHLSGAHLSELRPFTTFETLMLLRKMVGNQRVNAEHEAALRIATACEGMPLAIRIVGNRLATRRTWSMSYLADMLTPDAILDALACQETSMRTVIAHSYDDLSPDLQRAFRYLSLVGANDFSSWTASLVLSKAGSEHLVEGLRDRSLLLDAGRDPAGRPRYVMGGLLRQYAREILRQDPDFPAALDHILTMWTEVADYADAHIEPHPLIEPPARLPVTHPVTRSIATKIIEKDPEAWLESERHTLTGAVRLALASDLPGHALRLAVRLNSYLLRHFPDESECMWRSLTEVSDAHVRREARRNLEITLASR